MGIDADTTTKVVAGGRGCASVESIFVCHNLASPHHHSNKVDHIKEVFCLN
jgi:hypothetical protein